MKRICSLFLTLLMILALSVPAGAVNNDIPSEKIIDGRSVYSYSMDEIQDLLLDFFEENNISLEPGTRAYLKSSLPDLIETCSAGDIVQLCNEDTIVPYHTIIITYNNGSTIKYCGHSYDRLDEEGTATFLEPTENDFLIFKF